VVRRASRVAAVCALLLACCAFVVPDAISAAPKPRPAAPVPRPLPTQWGQLEEAVTQLRAGFRGAVSVYVEDLQTGRSIAVDPDRPIPAASLIKLPLAVAVLEQELAGKIALDTELTLKATDKADGSGVLKRYRAGTRLTVANLLELMLQRSDNTATNILTDLLGLEEINGSCRRQGLGATCMPRYIMDLEARDRKIENVTSAADMARILKGLYARKILDGPSCERLLDILKGQQVRDRLPRYLPSGVVLAHKTGLMNKQCHDAGILFGRNHDYVVVVLTADFPSFWYAKDAIGKVGRMVYRYDAGESLAPPKASPKRRSPQPAKSYKVVRRR
jgi:beta-lactamase class A